MSNAGPNEKTMFVGQIHAGEVWTDVLGWEKQEVTIDNDGHGLFPCPSVSNSIFVKNGAAGREKFGKL